MLFLDLDDFKAVNDTVGHAAGDRVLQTISSRLRSALRVGDTVARLGGDEFAILLEDVAHETGVSEIVEKLLEAISAPLTIDDREVSVQCSIGIAVAQSTATPAAVISVDELLRDADVAMYQAKAARGNTYRHFKPAMHEAVVEAAGAARRTQGGGRGRGADAGLPADLRPAHGEIGGYEALLRWEHADARHRLTGDLHPRG